MPWVLAARRFRGARLRAQVGAGAPGGRRRSSTACEWVPGPRREELPKHERGPAEEDVEGVLKKVELEGPRPGGGCPSLRARSARPLRRRRTGTRGSAGGARGGTAGPRLRLLSAGEVRRPVQSGRGAGGGAGRADPVHARRAAADARPRPLTPTSGDWTGGSVRGARGANRLSTPAYRPRPSGRRPSLADQAPPAALRPPLPGAAPEAWGTRLPPAPASASPGRACGPGGRTTSAARAT